MFQKDHHLTHSINYVMYHVSQAFINEAIIEGFCFTIERIYKFLQQQRSDWGN
jgi:hypothetical protein